MTVYVPLISPEVVDSNHKNNAKILSLASKDSGLDVHTMFTVFIMLMVFDRQHNNK
jgi:hypothetical protein